MFLVWCYDYRCRTGDESFHITAIFNPQIDQGGQFNYPPSKVAESYKLRKIYELQIAKFRKQ